MGRRYELTEQEWERPTIKSQEKFQKKGEKSYTKN